MKELLSHKQAKQRLGKLRKALPEVSGGRVLSCSLPDVHDTAT
jgi:hypothetical protein